VEFDPVSNGHVDRRIPETVVMRCEDSVSHFPNSSKTHSELVALYLRCCRSYLKVFWGVGFERMMIGCRGDRRSFLIMAR
jgi:hypothetical protein